MLYKLRARTPYKVMAIISLAGILSLSCWSNMRAQATGSVAANPAEALPGTWHWMFKGQPFVTMVLRRGETGFAGTITKAHVELGDDGQLSSVYASQGIYTITVASLDSSVLHISAKDGDDTFECTVTLKDALHAEIRLAGTGAPPNLHPILAEKVTPPK